MGTLRQDCDQRLTALKRLRVDYEPEWFDIARFCQPSRSRFLTTQGATGSSNTQQRSLRRLWNGKLLDPHGIAAFRILTNGMTSGLTSASRPWFTLTIKNEDLLEEDGVRSWLSDVEERLYSFLAQTNFYGAAKTGYSENGLFGTEACVMLEHDEKGMVCHPLTIGEYWIASGDKAIPDVLYRWCPMTVREAVQCFGNDVSALVRQKYDSGSYTDQVDIYQAIEPASDYDPARFGSKPWRSVYWDNQDGGDRVMRVSGFNEQPFWAARWDINGGDTWGSSPGMDCLPAVRELQMHTKRGNEAVDGFVKPEKIVPPGVRLTGQPGRTVTASGVTKENVVVPYAVPYQAIEAIEVKAQKCRQQIDTLSFAELFNAITNMAGIQPRTVEEIAARNEEKLTQLGPVIERVSTEKLEIAIERAYSIMLRGNLLPPVPQALSGKKFDIEFVSILTQMQRMIGLGQIERTMAFVGNTAGAKPEALDLIDTDEMIEEYSHRAGAPTKMLLSRTKVEEIRAARAKQQQIAQMAAAAKPTKDAVDAARLASESDDNGLSLMDRMQGASPVARS